MKILRKVNDIEENKIVKNFEKALNELVDILGPQNIFIDKPSRLLYSYDASMIRAIPCGVIHINDIEKISPVIKILHKYDVPYTPRLSGTNLSGGATNQKGGVVINLCGCNKIHQIDTVNRIAVVEAGVVNLKLQEELKKFGFFYPPDPASQNVSTIGGNIAENAGGPQCLKYGVTMNNVLKIDVVLPDGTEASFSVNDYGPQLINLFIGSEGTIGIIKKAYLKILPIPPFITTITAEFESIEDSMRSVIDIIKSGIIPKAMEVVDKLSVEAGRNIYEIGKEIEAFLIIDIESDSEDELKSELQKIKKILDLNFAKNIKHSDDNKERERLWKLRKDAYPSLARIANNILVEDGCVPRSKLIETVKNIKRIIMENNIKAGLVFHAGDGNIHPNIIFDERDKKETNKVRKAAKEILIEYIKNGGTISAEHGVGVEKRGFISIQHSSQTIELLKRIKNNIDPKNLSNPYKKLPLINEFKKIERKDFEISENVKAIITEVKKRYEQKKPSIIMPANSKPENIIYSEINTRNITKIIDFDIENMSITFEAGIVTKNIVNFLKTEGFSIYLPETESSVGSIIARNDFIELRDNILSMDIILPSGELIRTGGKNIKDNSIYDITRMMIGSYGTLGIITVVTFKIYKKLNPVFTKPKNTINITAIHKEIKKAFDPYNLFNPHLTEKIYGINYDIK